MAQIFVLGLICFFFYQFKKFLGQNRFIKVFKMFFRCFQVKTSF